MTSSLITPFSASRTSQNPCDSTLDLTHGSIPLPETSLHEQTEKLFKIVNSQKQAKYVDWKESTLHLQLKANRLTDYDDK
mmetsp:Transcript_12523/g.14344  ORF Transcript_12523/g.14344 Transcript_12523/m.14344 type:complete len:80 (+) Transcript_12523:393-632(+)